MLKRIVMYTVLFFMISLHTCDNKNKDYIPVQKYKPTKNQKTELVLQKNEEFWNEGEAVQENFREVMELYLAGHLEWQENGQSIQDILKAKAKDFYKK